MDYSELKRIVEKNGYTFYDDKGAYGIIDKENSVIASYTKGTGDTIPKQFRHFDFSMCYDVPPEILEAVDQFSKLPGNPTIVNDTDQENNISNIINKKWIELSERRNLNDIHNWKYEQQLNFLKMLDVLNKRSKEYTNSIDISGLTACHSDAEFYESIKKITKDGGKDD